MSTILPPPARIATMLVSVLFMPPPRNYGSFLQLSVVNFSLFNIVLRGSPFLAGQFFPFFAFCKALFLSPEPTSVRIF